MKGSIKGLKKESGYTLLELVIIMAVISILAAIAFPSYTKYIDNAKKAKAAATLAELGGAITVLGTDTLYWPGGERASITSDESDGKRYSDLLANDMGIFNDDGFFSTSYTWRGPYLKNNFLNKAGTRFIDPWERDYFMDYKYKKDGKKLVVVGSEGPDETTKDDNIIFVLMDEGKKKKKKDDDDDDDDDDGDGDDD